MKIFLSPNMSCSSSNLILLLHHISNTSISSFSIRKHIELKASRRNLVVHFGGPNKCMWSPLVSCLPSTMVLLLSRSLLVQFFLFYPLPSPIWIISPCGNLFLCADFWKEKPKVNTIFDSCLKEDQLCFPIEFWLFYWMYYAQNFSLKIVERPIE